MAKSVDLSAGRAPKGIRLCNPLNIERSSATWQGLVEQSRESRFCEFHTLEYGWRAAIINIAVTYRNRGWNTIEKIINHWAPAPENDPKAYIGFVSSFSGIPKDKVLEDIRIMVLLANPPKFRLVFQDLDFFHQLRFGQLGIQPHQGVFRHGVELAAFLVFLHKSLVVQ